MLNIDKLDEPATLISYRKQPNAEYDGPQFTPVKADIRTQLLKSQGYLCAYCMARIQDNQFLTKIEHWQCQDKYPERQLDYTNMLAVCNGNTLNELHCDSLKGNKDLIVNPSELAHRVESLIKYTALGEIYSDNNEQLNNELNAVLNLNYMRLKSNRESVMKSVIDVLNKITGTAKESDLQRLLDKWRAVNADGQKQPYCGIAIYYLNKKLSKNK